MIFYRILKGGTIRNQKPINTMIVVGPGGHLSEMISFIAKLDFEHDYSPVKFVIANDDNLTLNKIQEKFGHLLNYEILKIKRSRQVGQSYVSSIWTTLHSLIESLIICWQHQPKLLLCNGPGTCIPICFATRLMSSGALIVFVESFCRTKTLSLSGKIIYYLHLSDYFLVQWEYLRKKYKRSEFIGLLV